MNINTSVDDIFWMNPIQGDWASGTEIASNFARGMQMAEDKRRFDLQLPLKMKEAEVNIARDVAQTAKAAWELDYAKKEALAETTETPEWMKFNEQVMGAMIDPAKPLPQLPNNLTGQRVVRATALLRDAAMKKADLEAKTAKAMALTADAKDRAELIQGGYLMPEFESDPKNVYLARAKRAQQQFGKMASEAGITDMAEVQMQFLPNGNLDEAWAMNTIRQNTPAPTVPEGMEISGVHQNKDGTKSYSFSPKQGEKPTEKLKTENEWVQANLARISGEKNEDGELRYKTPEQAVTAARAEYRAMSGKQPEKSEQDTFIQAERLAKSLSLPFVKSPAERNALKPGQEYVLPNGTRAIKR